MATATLTPSPAHHASLPATQSTQAPQTPTAEDTAYISSSWQPLTRVTIPRGPVTAPLNYYAAPPDNSIPYNYVEPQPDGRPQRNFDQTTIPTAIRDIRGQESSFGLDTHAFAALTTGESAEKDFTDDASIERNYYPEVEKLLLENVPGAQRVVFFDHTIRRSAPDSARGAVQRVHIDQTPSSAAERVRRHAPEDAETLLKGRYRIINVWRPLNGPVVTHPLAVADSKSVPDEDLIPVEHRYPDRTGQTAAVKHSGGQEWWYWSGMRNEERLLLQCFDSGDLRSRVPHTAFEDPRAEKGAPGRESIEVRTLVFG